MKKVVETIFDVGWFLLLIDILFLGLYSSGVSKNPPPLIFAIQLELLQKYIQLLEKIFY